MIKIVRFFLVQISSKNFSFFRIFSKIFCQNILSEFFVRIFFRIFWVSEYVRASQLVKLMRVRNQGVEYQVQISLFLARNPIVLNVPKDQEFDTHYYTTNTFIAIIFFGEVDFWANEKRCFFKRFWNLKKKYYGL